MSGVGMASGSIPGMGGTIAGGSPGISSTSSFSPAGMFAGSLGAGADIFGGFSEMGQYNMASDSMKQQANMAIKQASLDAQAKAMQVQQFTANQGEEYASSGVTLKGTPAQVMASTRNLGQQEVNAIAQRGAFQAQLYRTQANQLKSAGRSAMLGGLIKGAAGMASLFI